VATLKPGSYNDVLSIYLHVETLCEATTPEYEALSYAWGQDISSEKALINNVPTTITANLDCALRHLRYQDKSRTLWIDALCINQADTYERNAQVQLMNRIYPSASEVIIWLGSADEDEIRAINTVKVSWAPLDLQSFEALIRICKRPWFRRVWVAQELALAQTDPMVYLGASTIQWAVFLYAVLELWGATPEQICSSVPPITDDLVRKFRYASKAARSLWAVRESRSRATFSGNLTRMRDFLATDPRDKIYGILGLSHVSGSALNIKPDYTKTATEVFTETATHLIHEGPVRFYDQFPLQSTHSDHAALSSCTHTLPSWVPNFSITSWSPEEGNFYNNVYTCHHIRENENSLRARPSRLGAIARFGPKGTVHTVGRPYGAIVETSKDLLWSTDTRHSISVPVTITTMIRPLIHIHNTMLKPRNLSIEDLVPELFVEDDRDLRTILDMLRVEQENGSDLGAGLTEDEATNLKHVARRPNNRVFFITSEGHTGVAYHPDAVSGIRPGDVLVGLFGVNIPLLLRRSESGKDYHMINVAHVAKHACCHAPLMDAPEETTEDDVWNDPGWFGLQKYTIV